MESPHKRGLWSRAYSHYLDNYHGDGDPISLDEFKELDSHIFDTVDFLRLRDALLNRDSPFRQRNNDEPVMSYAGWDEE